MEEREEMKEEGKSVWKDKSSMFCKKSSSRGFDAKTTLLLETTTRLMRLMLTAKRRKLGARLFEEIATDWETDWETDLGKTYNYKTIHNHKITTR
jgi:hypothetical protein